MIKYFFCLIAIILSGSSIAQVGIGNPTPESTSILDLTNPSNKGLILPQASSFVSMSESEKMMYFFEGNLYFRRTDGYNSISPWKFKYNGDISNHIYFNLNGNIGIGLTDITQSPEAPLQIETDMPVSLTENGTLLLGKSSSTNLVFNSKQIQSRNAGSAAPLTINEDGGDITVGSEATPVNFKVSNKNKGEYRPTNSTYDLMPKGAIVMWSGTSLDIPLGWAICDGGKYPTSINTNDSIISPDLSGRFIVTVGDNGTSNYDPGDTGGLDAVLITTELMPNHQHNSKDLGHSHSYSYQSYSKDKKGRSGVGRNISEGYTSVSGSTSSAVVSLAQNPVGGNLEHENRPSFYALVYIIKL